MDEQKNKCVMVIDAALPVGVAANTAAVLGVTLGQRHPELVGPPMTDGSGGVHCGIIRIPVPVLKGDAASLRALREQLAAPEYAELETIDFSDLAQSCRTYDEYLRRGARVREDALDYRGVAIFGDRKKIARLTGSLPLLR